MRTIGLRIQPDHCRRHSVRLPARARRRRRRPGAEPPSDEFVSEKTFFRTSINGKAVRLEGFIVKRADLTGPLPIALITHGKSANLADMLALRASDYGP